MSRRTSPTSPTSPSAQLPTTFDQDFFFRRARETEEPTNQMWIKIPGSDVVRICYGTGKYQNQTTSCDKPSDGGGRGRKKKKTRRKNKKKRRTNRRRKRRKKTRRRQ